MAIVSISASFPSWDDGMELSCRVRLPLDFPFGVGTARASAPNNCEMLLLSSVITTLFLPQYFGLPTPIPSTTLCQPVLRFIIIIILYCVISYYRLYSNYTWDVMAHWLRRLLSTGGSWVRLPLWPSRRDLGQVLYLQLPVRFGVKLRYSIRAVVGSASEW